MVDGLFSRYIAVDVMWKRTNEFDSVVEVMWKSKHEFDGHMALFWRVRVRVESDKDEEILGTNKLELRKLKRIREQEESLKISYRRQEEFERQELERLAWVSSSFAACRLEIQAAEIFGKQVEALKKRELEKRLISLGYTFNPDDGILLHHHLREKCLENALGFYAILEEADVYAKHPQNLIDNYRALAAGNVGYFFTRSRPNETQPDTSTSTDHVQAGHWIFGKELDVLHQVEKVGVKQLLEYCAAGAKTGYKIIEYRLDPCPDNLKDGPWFLCKLYNDGSYMEVQSSL